MKRGTYVGKISLGILVLSNLLTGCRVSVVTVEPESEAGFSVRSNLSTVCVGDQVQVVIEGGNAPFSFNKKSGPGSIDSAGIFTADAEGTPIIEVTDAKGVLKQFDFVIAPAFDVSPGNSSVAKNSATQFTPSGCQGPYQYSLLQGTGSLDAQTGIYTSSNVGETAVIRVKDSLNHQKDISLTTPSLNLSGLVLNLKFEEPSATGDRTFVDLSSSNANAFCVEAKCPQTISGNTGKNYIRFVGGDYLDLGTQLPQAFPENSISAWIRNADGHLYERGVWDNDDGYGMVFGAGIGHYGHWFGGGGYFIYNLPLTTSAPFSFDGNWHHFVGTTAPVGDGTTIWKVYIDGVFDRSTIDNRVITASGAPTMIGRRWNEERYFVGDVSNLTVWDRALTPAEVLDIYQSNVGVASY